VNWARLNMLRDNEGRSHTEMGPCSADMICSRGVASFTGQSWSARRPFFPKSRISGPATLRFIMEKYGVNFHKSYCLTWWAISSEVLSER
jgi:hypothetical protein